MVSKDQSEQDTDNELPTLQERCEFTSDDEDDSIGETNINKSKWEINKVLHTRNIYDNEFPPLPTIDNTFPTHIHTNRSLSSVSSITIEKRGKKLFNKVDAFLTKWKKINDVDESQNTSIHSYNQSTIHSHRTHKTRTQNIPSSISILPTKRTTRKNYKQDSTTTASSKHSHDSNWENSQPDTIIPLRSPTLLETNSNLINEQYSNKINTYINNRNNKTKNNTQNTNRKNLFYKNKNYQMDMQSHHIQNEITIDNPKPYTDKFPERNPNHVNISSSRTHTTNNNMNEPHEHTHNVNIFHQIATDTNLIILSPTEYNQIKQQQPKTNQQVITHTSQQNVALYQTIQLNRKQLHNIQ